MAWLLMGGEVSPITAFTFAVCDNCKDILAISVKDLVTHKVLRNYCKYMHAGMFTQQLLHTFLCEQQLQYRLMKYVCIHFTKISHTVNRTHMYTCMIIRNVNISCTEAPFHTSFINTYRKPFMKLG